MWKCDRWNLIYNLCEILGFLWNIYFILDLNVLILLLESSS